VRAYYLNRSVPANCGRLHRIAHTRRNAAGEITTPWSSTSITQASTDMYEQWVKGTALSGGDPVIVRAAIDTTATSHHGRSLGPGRQQPSDGFGIKFPHQLLHMVQANY